MSQDVFTLLGEMTTENLMEIISESMDDFLYVFDIQNNKDFTVSSGSVYDIQQIFGRCIA